MILAFMALWLLGGWLMLMCSALIWTERVLFYQQLPNCARCDYDLTGLSASANCPECNGADRKLRPVGRAAHSGGVVAAVWVVPPITAIVVAGMACVLLGLAGLAASLLVGVSAATFTLFSLFARAMQRWLPEGAPVRLVVYGAGAMSAALGALVWIVARDRLTPDLGLLALVPVLVWPFCGFGLLALIASPGRGRRARRQIAA